MTAMNGLEPRLYNSRIISNYLFFLRETYPEIDTDRLLQLCGIRKLEVADEGAWFTQKQADLFNYIATVMSGNANLAREAGLFSCSPGSMGLLHQYVLSMAGPLQAWKIIDRANRNLSHGATLTLNVLASNKVEVIAHVVPGVAEKYYQCLNRTGSFEGFARIFCSEVTVEHPECRYAGGNECRYVVTWQQSAAYRLQELRNLSAAVCLAAIGMGELFGTAITRPLVPFVPVLIMGLWYLVEASHRRECESLLSELNDQSRQQLRTSYANHDNAVAINKIGAAISYQSDLKQILDSVLATIKTSFGYDLAAIFIVEPATGVLEFKAGFTSNHAETAAPKVVFSPSNSQLYSLIEQVFKGGNEFISAPLSSDGDGGKGGRAAGECCFAMCPIACNGSNIGVLAVGSLHQGTRIMQSDLSLINGIAPLLGVCVNNAALMATKNQQLAAIKELQSTLAALAREKTVAEKNGAELKEINEEVKSFAYIVSHDLRAPLVNIKGYATELSLFLDSAKNISCQLRDWLTADQLRQLDLAINEDIPEALGYITHSAERMDSLITAILKLNRVGRKGLSLEAVNTKDLCEDILMTLGHQLRERQVTVQLESLPVLATDRDIVDQVLRNLLDNSVKYLPSDKPGHLRIGSYTTDIETVFFVEDNGRGIAAQDMGKIFEIFRRAGRQDTPGEGMGLPYVRALLRRLDGRIWCESVLGSGSTFYFSLPKQPVALPGPARDGSGLATDNMLKV